MASGLIDLQAPVPQATGAAPYTAAQTAAKTANVTSAAARQADLTKAAVNTGAVDAPQTVQGQLKGILDTNSPLQQQAEARARQQAGARGLANTSMAVEAGQAAVIGSALPIAQQDASTFSRQSLQNQADVNRNQEFNASAANQGSQFNVGEANTTSKFNVGEANVVSKFNADQANAIAQANTTAANDAAKTALIQQNDMIKANLDVASKSAITNLEANYKTLIQSSASAQSIQQQLLANLERIQNNKDLDGAARQVAINQQVELTKNSLNLLGAMNNLNLDALLTFGSGVTTPELLTLASPPPVDVFGRPIAEPSPWTPGPGYDPNVNRDAAGP